MKACRRNAEVRDQRRSVGIEQHVVRFHVTMHDAMPMRVIQPHHDLRDDGRAFVGWHGAMAREAVGQRATAQERHHHERAVPRDAGVQDRAHVGMTEPARRLGLAAKSLAHLRIARQVCVEHLDHHATPQHRVRGLVHVRHAATRDAPHDREASPRRAAQGRDLRIGDIHRRSGDVGQHLAAAHAVRCRRSVPGAAVWAEHAGRAQAERFDR